MSGEYMENENEFRTVTLSDGTTGIIPSMASVMRACDESGVVDMEYTVETDDERHARQARTRANLDSLSAEHRLQAQLNDARRWAKAWKGIATCYYRAWHGRTPTPSMLSTMARLVGEKAVLVAERDALQARIDAMEAAIDRIRDARQVVTIAPDVTMELVRIPAGEFLMGSTDADRATFIDEKPQHKVMLDEYMIGKYAVTNEQYAVFVKAKDLSWTMPQGKDNHPVVQVSWDDTVAFCVWASQVTGRTVRLPTEAQWEKAARGTDGRIYPWGNEAPNANLANFNNNEKGTTVVGKYSPTGDSPYGLADTAGNVWEWIADWYSDTYYASSPSSNPQGPTTGQYRVLRGGSWFYLPDSLRAANRNWYVPSARLGSFGFRVAVSAPLNSVMRSCDADGVVDMEHTMNPSGDGSNYEYAPRGTMARVLEYQQRIETLDRIAQSEMVLRATCETQAKMLRNAETDMRRMHERIVILETREVEQTEYTEQLERDYTAARAAACAWVQK